MIFLREIVKRAVPEQLDASYPFNCVTVRELTQLAFRTPVTFFVGENGSGKSTLLEAIAGGARLPVVGSRNIQDDETLHYARLLSEYLQLVWSVKRGKGFFLRAEDFFGFTKRLHLMRAELQEEIIRLDTSLPDGYGKQLAVGALQGQIADLTQRYGIDLDAGSHGEAFLKLFSTRIKPGGLYLLDEPEAPLSPTRTMSLMVLIGEMVLKDCQFIIATHSPVLMAFPGATIYSFDEHPVRTVAYEELGHVQTLSQFLAHKDSFLRHLGLQK